MTTATMDRIELDPNLNWEADYQIRASEGEPAAPDMEWVNALLYDTDDVREFVENGGLYHERTGHNSLVAYSFRFSISPDDLVIAHGRLHPAIERRGDYHTDESEILAQADIVVRQLDYAADQQLRRYLRVQHLGQLPDLKHGFPQPANQVCRHCREMDGEESGPIFQCPACDETFCDSCTDITAWTNTYSRHCPHCGQQTPA